VIVGDPSQSVRSWTLVEYTEYQICFTRGDGYFSYLLWPCPGPPMGPLPSDSAPSISSIRNKLTITSDALPPVYQATLILRSLREL